MISRLGQSLVLLAALLHHSTSAWHLYEEARSPGDPLQSHQVLLGSSEQPFGSNQQQALGSLSAGIAELAVNSLQQASGERPTNLSSSSLVGRILEAASPEKAGSSTPEKLGAVGLQLLKARKPTNVDSIEQQIISQHAGHHLTRLASKHRDNKIANSIAASVSNSRDSPIFSSLFDALKSGATSRSSIVKAISDNKLSRTLSEVGKSISGNKYVAGAAFASAIAALGLTVSKLMSPYLFGQTNSLYPKLGADLMSSDSGLRPQMMASYPSVSYSGSPTFGNPNSLQMSYDNNGVDSFSSSASDSPTFLPPKPMAKVSTGEAAKQADTNGYYSSYYLQQPDSGETLAPVYYSSAQYQAAPVASLDQSELAQSGSLESPAFTPAQRVQQVSHKYGAQPAYLAIGGLPGRRSGAMALRLDESAKMQLYEQLKRQYLPQRQVTQPALTRTNEKPLTSDNQQYVTAAKPYAPTVGVGQQQGQRSATTAKSGHLQPQLTPAYLIMRPKTSNQSAPEAAPQSPWRSFDETPAEAPDARPPVRLSSSGWHSVGDSSSKAAPQEAQQVPQVQEAPQTIKTQTTQQAHQQTAQQQAGDSPAAGLGRQQVNRESEPQEKPSGAVAAANGAEPAESQLLQRVSRTTSSSASVKANRPTTSLTDYESLEVSPSKQVAFVAGKSESPQVASPPQAITMVSRPPAANNEGYNDADDSKANLVQLSVDDSGAEDDVKLIEANTKSGGDRLAEFDSGLVIMLPSTIGRQGAQSERATSMRTGGASGDFSAQQVAQERGGKTADEAEAESAAANAFSSFVGGSLANHH